MGMNTLIKTALILANFVPFFNELKYVPLSYNYQYSTILYEKINNIIKNLTLLN